VYADWQAAVWGGEEGLTAILTQAQENESHSRRPGWLRLHPTASDRLLLLKQPERLFRVTLDIPVYAGLLSGITITGMIPLLIQVFSASVAGATALTAVFGTIGITSESSFVAWSAILFAAITQVAAVLLLIVPFLIITVQLAGSLGLQVAREAVADLASHQQHRGFAPLLRLLPSAALFSLGMQVGFLLVPFSFLTPLAAMLYAKLEFGLWVRAAAETIAWVIVMTGLAWLALAYLRWLAQRTLGEHTGATAPHRKRRAITALTTLLLWTIVLAGIGWQYNIYRMIWAQLPLGVLAGVTVATLIGAGLILGIGAAWIGARRLLGRPRCPVCETPTKARIVVGRICHHCGSDLAPWLFVS